MVGFSVILVGDALAQNLLEHNVRARVLHAQVHGVVQHVDLDAQALFGQSSVKRLLVRRHHLGIRHIVGRADLHKLLAVVHSRHVGIVQPVRRVFAPVGGQGEIDGLAHGRLPQVIPPVPDSALVGLQLEHVNVPVRAHRVPAATPRNMDILFIRSDRAGIDLCAHLYLRFLRGRRLLRGSGLPRGCGPIRHVRPGGHRTCAADRSRKQQPQRSAKHFFHQYFTSAS